jgi:hypothetical protein
MSQRVLKLYRGRIRGVLSCYDRTVATGLAGDLLCGGDDSDSERAAPAAANA